MSVSSLVKKHKIPLKTSEDVITVNDEAKLPVEKRVKEVFRLMLCTEILDTVKAFSVILVILSLFEFSGLFGWWMQFVGKL